MDFLAGISFDQISGFLSQAAQADLTGKLIIVGIVWKAMGRKVADHFGGMERAVQAVAGEVKDLKKTMSLEIQSVRDAVKQDADAQNARLTLVEDGLTTVKADIQTLKSKPPKE